MQHRQQHRQAYVLLLLTTLFWGGNAVAGKLAVGHVSPMLLTAARWAIAFVLLSWLGRDRFRADWPATRPKLPLLLLLGALGFAIFNIALYSALNYTTAINEHRAGRHADAHLHPELRAVPAPRRMGPDRRLPGLGCRRGADGKPWRAAKAAGARRQFRRCADADRRHR